MFSCSFLCCVEHCPRCSLPRARESIPIRCRVHSVNHQPSPCLDHIVRSSQHMQPVIATASHQVDVVLEVSQTVPLRNLPHRLGCHFRVGEDQAIHHLGIGDGPAADRPETANRQYQRNQQALDLHGGFRDVQTFESNRLANPQHAANNFCRPK